LSAQDEQGEQRRTAVARAVERELSVLLGRSRALSTELARHVHPDVDTASYVMLMQLREWGAVRAADAAERTGFDKSTVSRQLSKLEELALIERVTDPDDGRARLVQLTETGRERLDRVRAERQQRLHERFDTWSTSDLHAFAELLVKLNETL
jgi:DNA-binding MarR family transcriptional regulator